MVNGMPGNMAALIGGHCLADDRFDLVPYSLTGPEVTATEHAIQGSVVALVHPGQRAEAIGRIIDAYGPFITVDYTHPAAVNSNAEFYCYHRLPFVMGTTGGDRKLLEETVRRSLIPAVISPNMAKQIVGFQAMMAYAANTFPNLFHGYSLEVRESHQQTKADTSGTAKAMITYFKRMGIPFSTGDIQMERDPVVQKETWGVPDKFIEGHGWHTYTLTSGDGRVNFEFTHNVNGRDIYAGGTLDAVAYLHEKINQGVTGKVMNMIDVLKGA